MGYLLEGPVRQAGSIRDVLGMGDIAEDTSRQAIWVGDMGER